LQDGGFTRRYQLTQEKPLEVGGTLHKMQLQNMRLQNLKLSNEIQITELAIVINQLKTRQYIWWGMVIITFLIGYLIGHSHKH